MGSFGDLRSHLTLGIVHYRVHTRGETLSVSFVPFDRRISLWIRGFKVSGHRLSWTSRSNDSRSQVLFFLYLSSASFAVL